MINSDQRARFLKFHQILGIFISLPFLFMFVTGCFSFLRSEMLQWQKPELAFSEEVNLDRLAKVCKEKEPALHHVHLNLPSESKPVCAMEIDAADHVHYVLKPNSYELDKTSTVWIDQVIWLHFLYFLPEPLTIWGYRFAGLIGLACMMLMLSGFIFLWKTIKKDIKLPKKKKGTT